MLKVGNGLAAHGCSVAALAAIAKQLVAKRGDPGVCTLHLLHTMLPEDKQSGNEAAVLHIRGDANLFLDSPIASDLLAEQSKIVSDTKHRQYGKVVNNIARKNIVFAPE